MYLNHLYTATIRSGCRSPSSPHVPTGCCDCCNPALDKHVRTNSWFYKFDAFTYYEHLEAAQLWHDFGQEIGKRAEVEAALRELLR